MGKAARNNGYNAVYDAMNEAIPNGSTMHDVIIAAEFIIACCIDDSNISEEERKPLCEAIGEDIGRFTEALAKSAYVK